MIDQLPGAIGRNQRTSSTGFFPKKTGKSGRTNNNMAAQRSQRYEAIISLYDKLLEDEDKLLLQKKKKEKREKRLQRQKLKEQGQQPALQSGSEEDDDLDEDAELSIDLEDDDDFEDALISDESAEHLEEPQSFLDEGAEDELAKGVDLDDLQTYHN